MRRPMDLEYAKPTEKLSTDFNDFITGLFVGRLRSRWLYRQFAWYLVLALIFFAIPFYFANNYFFFGKLSRLTAADFVDEVRERCVPVVRAMKEFERDHGRLPNEMKELIPDCLPDQSHKMVQLYGAFQGQFQHYANLHHTIRY